MEKDTIDIIAEIAKQQKKTPEQVTAELEAGIDEMMNSENPEVNLMRAIMIPHKKRLSIKEYLQLSELLKN